MPRMFRRSFGRRRSTKRRTRWFALVPHALTPIGDNSWDSQEMEIRDRDGTISYQQLIGGTVLRTICDIVCDPGLPEPVTPVDYVTWAHFGIGMPTQLVPDQADWDPNTPFAEFMWRYTWARDSRVREIGAATPELYTSFTHTEGLVVRCDTTQRRRIRENMSMWIFVHQFLPGSAAAASVYGYTGRVLIQLP